MEFFCICRLEITPAEVKSIYVAAAYLKMDRIAAQCTVQLLEDLTPETCLEIRGLPGIVSNENFVKQVDAYIRQNVSVCHVRDVVIRTRDHRECLRWQ